MIFKLLGPRDVPQSDLGPSIAHPNQTQAAMPISINRQRPFASAFLPVPKFPLTQEVRFDLFARLSRWIEALPDSAKLSSMTVLEVNKLPLDKGGPKVSSNGRLWLPSTGLGIFPHQPPPRLWTDDDFLEREYGTPLPPLMNTVFLIQETEQAARHAFQAMLGSGSLTYLLTEAKAAYLQHTEDTLLPAIQEESLRGHPFYLPLLSVSAVQDADADLLREWMGPARVYLRESTEDGGILVIAATEPALRPLLA